MAESRRRYTTKLEHHPKDAISQYIVNVGLVYDTIDPTSQVITCLLSHYLRLTVTSCTDYLLLISSFHNQTSIFDTALLPPLPELVGPSAADDSGYKFRTSLAIRPNPPPPRVTNGMTVFPDKSLCSKTIATRETILIL